MEPSNWICSPVTDLSALLSAWTQDSYEFPLTKMENFCHPMLPFALWRQEEMGGRDCNWRQKT
jgi:hypothetical protein